MARTIDCKLTLSDSGRVMQLQHSNGRIIAEILIHGPLNRVVQNCDEEKPIVNGRANIYRGECWGLAGYEFLNINDEIVEERIA